MFADRDAYPYAHIQCLIIQKKEKISLDPALQ